MEIVEGVAATLGADDFTAWWVSALALGYATGESDGPYLLDPAGYYAAGLSLTQKRPCSKAH